MNSSPDGLAIDVYVPAPKVPSPLDRCTQTSLPFQCSIASALPSPLTSAMSSSPDALVMVSAWPALNPPAHSVGQPKVVPGKVVVPSLPACWTLVMTDCAVDAVAP